MGRLRRGKKDANHNEVVDAFLQSGASVAQLHACEVPGFPDIVIGVSGRSYLVEIKNPETRYGKAGLNRNQTGFAADWRGGPVFIVTSALEAIALVNKDRKSVG